MNSESEEGVIEEVVWIKSEEEPNDDPDHSHDPPDDRNLLCLVCNTHVRGTVYHLKRHMQRRHGGAQAKLEPATCNVCDKTFANRYCLGRHVKIHTGRKTYQCPTCEKHFNDKGNLNQHERIHSGEKRYGCKECDMKFTHKSTLNSHALTHTGLRAYKCAHCGMCFARAHTMKKHVGRKHSGDRKKSKRGNDK